MIYMVGDTQNIGMTVLDLESYVARDAVTSNSVGQFLMGVHGRERQMPDFSILSNMYQRTIGFIQQPLWYFDIDIPFILVSMSPFRLYLLS